MCSAAIFLCFLPTARATGTVTEPSPPIVIGTAPACTMRSTACSVRTKASTILPGVSLTLPQSTNPSADTGSKSAWVGLKRRISADCWRTESGPPRAPIRMLVPQSKGMPRMAALLCGPGRPHGAPMNVIGEVKRSVSLNRSMSGSRGEEVEGGEGVDLGDGAQLVDQDIFVGAAHVERRQAQHDGRHAVRAIPARVRAAHPHIDRDIGPQDFCGGLGRARHDLVVRWRVGGLEATGRAPLHAFERRQPCVELSR